MDALRERFATHDEYLVWADQIQDDVNFEIVEGYPVMTPAPGYPHQSVLVELLVQLRAACPRDTHVVLPGPFDWVLWELPALQVREPDILVIARPDDQQIRRIVEPPLLAVEILSPGSVERDLFTKRREYAAAGLDHYWVVDPVRPSIVTYRRVATDMAITATAAGNETLTVTEPFPATITPASLIA